MPTEADKKIFDSGHHMVKIMFEKFFGLSVNTAKLRLKDIKDKMEK